MNNQGHPLIASNPHPSLGAHANTFGRIMGSWAGEYREIGESGEQRGQMEVHLYWVLEGRAVQDVWITPSRKEMSTRGIPPLYWGSTMRIFDAATESWRMFWFNPVEPFVRGELVGRRVGDDIVQLGSYGDTPIKWVFEDITANSFAWRGYWMGPGGGDWNLSTEFLVRRV